MQRQNWNQDEDNNLIQLVGLYQFDWKKIAKELEKRGVYRKAKACRERYSNQLNPEINRADWTLEEENNLFELQNKYGNKWTEIAEYLPSRTDSIIKNYFYSTVRRVLRRLLKSAGNKKCSVLAKSIKPCVLSGIFSLGQVDDKRMVLDKKFTEEFRDVILKYRHLSFREIPDVNEEDQVKIESIYTHLLKFNDLYQDNKTTSQLQKLDKRPKQQVKCEPGPQIRAKKEPEELLLTKLRLKQPIFTTKKCKIEKYYLKSKQLVADLNSAGANVNNYHSLEMLQYNQMMPSYQSQMMWPSMSQFICQFQSGSQPQMISMMPSVQPNQNNQNYMYSNMPGVLNIPIGLGSYYLNLGNMNNFQLLPSYYDPNNANLNSFQAHQD